MPPTCATATAIVWSSSRRSRGIGGSHVVHDEAGHLLAEATTIGTVTREYIWLEDLSPAMVTDADTVSPRLYWLHTDHFGATEKATDAAAALVWDAVTTPFGVHAHLSGADSFESAQAGL